MPLPLGHTAMGLAIFEFSEKGDSASYTLRSVLFVTILASLPDIDVLYGLIFCGNGSAFHRGPTHSLLFALGSGLLASRAWKWWPFIPRINFWTGFFLVLSHILGDLLLTASSVSLLWPIQVYWSPGHMVWEDLFSSFFGSFQDIGIILTCTALILLRRFRNQLRHRTNRVEQVSSFP
jgi:membrane-bound metal-dependent hydrolase YbcI (DUF457 family)